MPLWWGKPSSKDVQRKTNRVSFIDAIHRKLIKVSAFKNLSKYGDSGKYFNDALSEKGLTFPRSESPSLLVSRCQSFNDHPHALPLPLPQWKHLSVRGDVSEVTTSEMGLHECPMRLPGSLHSKHDKPLSPDAWANLATASVSSYGSMDVDDQPESQILSPQASEHESGNLTASHSPSCMGHQDQSPKVTQQISMDQWKPVNMLPNNSIPLPSKHRGPLRTHMTKLQIPSRGGFFSAPDSSISTPSRSPVGACRHEQFGKVGCCSGRLCSDVIFVGSGQCSSPVSGQNSGDMSLLSPPSRCSPESSPILSPAVTSPGSQRQSGVATPLHPWAGLMAAETFMERPDDRKAQGHKLPCPLMTVPSSCSFPSSCLATHPRSPGRAEGVTRPNSCWKKGRLLGSGTYGRVYIGFNSESGEMCAMKEVALFPDDAKSKESVEQLEQEIKLLSHLKHSNIVRYFGSETVDDKLYIYLEYVSGGSIHKLLQEYGQLGESAIRSYTKQILSGLAYLHAKSTVHRDIKGANILVDPTGRVKLADFGMAKHITGQPCPLSFKGSPYWMAPEVIRNSNGCNLAVDVWSLGCTVIEMATAKPPWSQYEGVAALFKIGNSKELPTIPDHLSEEGKDFVRQCLQRNPLHRPTAVQLLKHPFVKNVAPLKRSLVHAELQELQQPVSNAARHMDIGCKKRYSGLEKERVNLQLARGFKIGSVSRETCIPKHLSCPVSPIGSPLLNTKLSQTTLSRMKSPSTLSRPHTVSALSTPYTRGTRAPPHHFAHSKTAYLYQSFPARRPQNGLYANQSPSYCKPRVGSETSHNIRGISQASRDSFFSKQQFY